LAATLLFASSASAQFSDMYDGYQPTREWFALSLGIGAYQPNVGNGSFEQIFGDEKGPYITGGIDFRVLRFGEIAALLASLHMGSARYSGRACDFAGGTVDCENRV